jgi:rhomboid protease GluP
MRALIAVNICMYVVSLLSNLNAIHVSANPLAFLSPDNRSLLLLGATGTIPLDNLHRWWTLVSANYLHGGILHLVFNMIALRQLGPLIAQEYGVSRMFILYTVTGIVGFAVSYWAGVRFTIGASAAVCGLIGAALYFGKSRGGAYGQAIYRQVGGWAVSIFIFGFLVPGINNWGHGGGMAAGALLGFLLGYQEQAREQLWHVIVANICMLLTILVLAWAILTSILYRFSG